MLRRAGELIDARAGGVRRACSRSRSARRNASRPPRPRRAGCSSTGTPTRPTTFPWEDERPGVRGPILVRRRPVGVVGAIVPWNYPLGLSFPKLSPALLTGCTVVLKPPEETPLFGSLLAEVFAAGRPAAGRAERRARPTASVGEALVTHPLVDKISFTGSTRGGAAHRRAVRRAAQAVHARAGRQVRRDPARRTPTSTQSSRRSRRAPWPTTARPAQPDARARAPRALRRGRRRAARGDRGIRRRRPCGPRDRRRPAHQRGAARARRGYIATGRAEGARLVLGGGRAGRDARLLRRADALRRRRQRDDDRPRGDLRPGGRRDPL